MDFAVLGIHWLEDFGAKPKVGSIPNHYPPGDAQTSPGTLFRRIAIQDQLPDRAAGSRGDCAEALYPKSRGLAATVKDWKERDRVMPVITVSASDMPVWTFAGSGQIATEPRCSRTHPGVDTSRPERAVKPGLLPVRGLSPKTGYEPFKRVSAKCQAPSIFSGECIRRGDSRERPALNFHTP